MFKTVILSPRRGPRNISYHSYRPRLLFAKSSVAVFLSIVLFLAWCNWSRYGVPVVEGELGTKERFELLWCRMQRARVDWKAVVAPCEGNTQWGHVTDRWRGEEPTSATTSYISYWDMQPAGEFSRFFIQSQTAEGTAKTVGGDEWRVHLIGPAYLAPTVMDHGNGSYEVLFLAMEHGTYQAKIVLDYSLCNGIRDPPRDWFIIGNMQGKGQRHPGVERNRDYIMDQLWNGTPVDIRIPPSTNGMKHWHEHGLYTKFTRRNMCGEVCNALWDGYGRWIDNKWRPYVINTPKYREPHLIREGTLCIYGDSLGMFFADSLYHRPICKRAFKHCTKNYNWIYPVLNFTIDRSKDDDLDFNQTRVLTAVESLLRSREMDHKSVIVFNFGLHYVESVNFTTYMKLVDSLVEVFKMHGHSGFGEKSDTTRGKPRVIWKTTTAINKQRASVRHLGSRRFLTYQRVLLFNAFATSAMCSAGIEVIDVYPVSDSYPWGTGTHASLKPAENDVVHYSNQAFKPAEDLLENMFLA
ncbi:uncharacterized protein LOC116604066 [Nematostella vectensis]|uniref:uncharacterized protein LOC116604066 n=1 Tax=Nematostella vectensis TaxID=45351 RepID=UPI00207731BD|nr:uncharacterized protein LOC116604066 [Nematostella vectensis]XP_032221805.2 uncharacterized protein LOC116604066 [Nematostella vectensis]